MMYFVSMSNFFVCLSMTQTTDVYCYLGMHVNDDAIRLDETRKNNDNYLTLIPPV